MHMRRRGKRSARRASALENLLVRTGLGDRGAAAELYDRTAPLLLALCIEYTGDHDAAQRRLADAFVRVWRYAPLYGHTGALDWMCHQARC